jgi:hypothetical protein
MKEHRQALNTAKYADGIAQTAPRNASIKTSKRAASGNLPVQSDSADCCDGVCQVTWKPQRPAA